MLKNISELNIVRIGSAITFSSLKELGRGIVKSFRGLIREVEISHFESPRIERIDAKLLTMILNHEYGGHTLGVTDADFTEAREWFDRLKENG